MRATGIEREFALSNLSPTQFSALESEERLYHSERAGLIRVTFNPENDTESRAELTDLGKATMQRNDP